MNQPDIYKLITQERDALKAKIDSLVMANEEYSDMASEGKEYLFPCPECAGTRFVAAAPDCTKCNSQDKRILILKQSSQRLICELQARVREALQAVLDHVEDGNRQCTLCKTYRDMIRSALEGKPC